MSFLEAPSFKEAFMPLRLIDTRYKSFEQERLPPPPSFFYWEMKKKQDLPVMSLPESQTFGCELDVSKTALLSEV